jgi:hypothetical protein
MFLAMRFLGLSLAASLATAAIVAGCGSDSSSGAAADAGPEAGSDASHDGSGCPFGCSAPDSGDAAADAPTNCAQMKLQLDSLGATARACNPNLSQQCSASTNGICCPISVSPGDPAPVENYDHAVAAYIATCGPVDCTTTICSMNIPSNACDAPMGSVMGICE